MLDRSETPLSDEPTRAPSVVARQTWLGVLARAKTMEIQSYLSGQPCLPAFVRLRGPETGMAMVRGRTGGGGAAFNVGEMNITRCSIRDETGRVGHGYTVGRDLVQAELIARLDAALQDDAQYAAYFNAVILPLAAKQATRRASMESRAAATEVKFFTLATMRA